MSYYDQTIPAGTGAVPLWAPYYGAPIGEAVKRFFKKYATFSGRASRSEYWWVALFSGVVNMVLNIMTSAAGSTVDANGTVTLGPGAIIVFLLLVIWWLSIFVPALALTARRLHDANFSGSWILIGLVPFVGWIVLLILVLQPSKPEGQIFDRPAAP